MEVDDFVSDRAHAVMEQTMKQKDSSRKEILTSSYHHLERRLRREVGVYCESTNQLGLLQ